MEQILNELKKHFKTTPRKKVLKTWKELENEYGNFNKLKDVIDLDDEFCVICGKQINYNKKLNIDNRLHYIDGCGQVCNLCYKEVNKI